MSRSIASHTKINTRVTKIQDIKRNNAAVLINLKTCRSWDMVFILYKLCISRCSLRIKYILYSDVLKVKP